MEKVTVGYTGKIPGLVKTKYGWELNGFNPGQPAFKWDSFQRKNATLYIMQCGDYLKIGVTKDLTRRLAQISPMNPLPVTVVAKRTVPLASLLVTEAWLHQRFADARVNSEWFRISVEEALAALPEAEAMARAYARYCRDWFQRDIARQINESL